MRVGPEKFRPLEVRITGWESVEFALKYEPNVHHNKIDLLLTVGQCSHMSVGVHATARHIERRVLIMAKRAATIERLDWPIECELCELPGDE